MVFSMSMIFMLIMNERHSFAQFFVGDNPVLLLPFLTPFPLAQEGWLPLLSYLQHLFVLWLVWGLPPRLYQGQCFSVQPVLCFFVSHAPSPRLPLECVVPLLLPHPTASLHGISVNCCLLLSSFLYVSSFSRSKLTLLAMPPTFMLY